MKNPEKENKVKIKEENILLYKSKEIEKKFLIHKQKLICFRLVIINT